MARTKSSSAWMREHVTDAFVQRARREGYRSRAAYKLLEIAERDRLLARGMTVVDLGAAPGGWSQVAADIVGRDGRVVAVDLLEMAPIPGVTIVLGDFRDEATLGQVEAAMGSNLADLVLSDMSPNITGIGAADQARAAHLAELALEFAGKWLKPGGNLLVKAFQGADYPALRESLRPRFKQLLTRKPGASRSRSSEIYLLAKGLTRTG